MNDLPEPQLEQRLLAAAAEDDDAFRRLYDAYLPRVYAYVGYRVGPDTDVEDVVAVPLHSATIRECVERLIFVCSLGIG